MHKKNSRKRAAFYFALLRKKRAIHSSAFASFQSVALERFALFLSLPHKKNSKKSDYIFI